MRKIEFAGLIILAVFSAFILSSCEKNDDYKIVINNSGNLTIKVLDENNQPCTGATVRIYGEGGKLYEDTTNTTGIFNIGKLLYGEYSYSISAKKENRKYSESRIFQIVAGDDKVIQINPYSLVSKVKITVVNYWTGQPMPDISLGLMPYESLGQGTSFSFEDYVKLCYYIKVTDSNGQVLFDEVPVGSIYSRPYTALIFTDETHWQTSGNSLNVYNGETRSYIIQSTL